MTIENKIVGTMSTWRFAWLNYGLVVAWCGVNLLLPSSLQFDVYPFIFLNLIVSLYAMVQNSIIMISQYKIQEADRRLAADNANDTKRILASIKRLESKLLDKLEDIEENLDEGEGE